MLNTINATVCWRNRIFFKLHKTTNIFFIHKLNRMKYLINALIIIVFFCQLACDDDSSDPKDMTNGIKLTFISEEIPSGSLAVENFSLLSAPATGDGNKKYYEFVYS